MAEGPVKIGKYRLEEPVGRGGMGTVYRCYLDPDRNTPLAIKVLSPALVANAAEHDAFLRECAMLAKLRHPHILPVRDFGVAEGLPYLVTDLCVDGKGKPCSLAALQERRTSRNVDPYVLATVIPEVCWALAYIHQNGLVHRDLKPENVLVQEDRQGVITTRLADFGLAKVTRDWRYRARTAWSSRAERVSLGLGQHADFSGTYDYMSPEQLAGTPLDASSDVYSLGVMIYRVATGYDRVYFEKPTEAVPQLPAWVDDLVARCIVRDRARRCPDALELLYSLPKSLRPVDLVRAEEEVKPKRPDRPKFEYNL